MNASTSQKNTKLIDKGSFKVNSSSNTRSQITPDAPTPKRDSKAINSFPASAISLKQPVVYSALKIVKAPAAQTLSKVIKVTAPQNSSETVKVAVSQTSRQIDTSKARDMPALKGKTALANVSNISVPSHSNTPKPVLETQQIKTTKAVPSNPANLSSLEENLVVER